eukprot:364600-Chlamydomonas_euryale.AAC.8
MSFLPPVEQGLSTKPGVSAGAMGHLSRGTRGVTHGATHGRAVLRETCTERRAPGKRIWQALHKTSIINLYTGTHSGPASEG